MQEESKREAGPLLGYYYAERMNICLQVNYY